MGGAGLSLKLLVVRQMDGLPPLGPGKFDEAIESSDIGFLRICRLLPLHPSSRVKRKEEKKKHVIMIYKARKSCVDICFASCQAQSVEA